MSAENRDPERVTSEAEDPSSSGAEDNQLAKRGKKKPSTATRKKSGKAKKSKSSSLPLDRLPVDDVADNAVGTVSNTLGSVANNTLSNVQGGGGGGGGKSDTLRLRLDLNLDIEITLKAKIHGDLELALL
ncbi:hypothetical protein HIM_02454 [Hirsutella minnesotensis 3608]|nr:hypothetical protein HIM_02454 [Hirsutella minnesotensis 3608]